MLKLKVVDNCAGRSLRPSSRGLEYSLGHCQTANHAASNQPVVLQHFVFQCITHIHCDSEKNLVSNFLR